MNSHNAGVGLHAFIARHLFKSKQCLGAYIHQQAYVLHLVQNICYNIYRQAAYVIYQPTSCPVQAFLNLSKQASVIHTHIQKNGLLHYETGDLLYYETEECYKEMIIKRNLPNLPSRSYKLIDE